ncbi:MAG: large subunit ribosomal protein [Chloroflexota bacterium]|jgi:large subunit ribosomal protein L21|nr:large subunit ribosomal protein [Chloroflexota bacterium]
MYAVIETGGKQYRVEVGTELEIELLEAGPGEAIAFERVLLVADGAAASIGRPVVANATVSAEVIRRDRGEKTISFKYRPKARSRVKKGHRQELTIIRISDIVLDGKSAASDLAKVEEQRRTERQKLEDAARKQAEQDKALAAKLAADKPAKADTKAAKPDAKAAKADAKPSARTSSSKTPTAKAAPPKKAIKADTTDKGAKAPTKAKATDASKASRARTSDKD